MSAVPGMAGRARFRLPLLAVVLLAGGTSAAAVTVLPVAIEVHARAFRPGEPLRIEVVTDRAAATLEGTFCDRAIFMVRTATRPDGGERWSGWSMIDLDRQPGVAAVGIRGRTADGRPLAGTRAVTVEPHDFPVEELSVAPRYVEPPPEVRARLDRERRELADVYRRRRPVAPAGQAFQRPVPGAPTSTFGTRRVFNGQPRSPHPGLDLRAAAGTAVQSAGPGRVTLASDLYYSGKTVIVDHGGGLFTIYAHLSELRVAVGDEIAGGDPVGLSGATGRVTGPHLHWGAKIGDVPFDPTALLDERLF